MIEYIGYGLVSTGVLVNVCAAVAVVRFPDVYSRLLGSTKCITLGTAAVMFGVFVLNGLSPTGIKALIAMLFILITSPVEAHALSRAAHRAGVKMADPSAPDAIGAAGEETE